MRLLGPKTAICLALLATPAGAEDNASPSGRLIENPLCEAKTYALPNVPGGVRAAMKHGEGPVIYLDERVLSRGNLTRFLLAHECCHHSLGHVESVRNGTKPTAVRGLQNWGRQIELDADCCAARLLKKNNDRPAVENAKQFMMRYGPKPTGFGYPSGFERSMVIRHCSTTDSNKSQTIYLNEAGAK